MILWCLVAGLTCFGFWCSSICMSNTAFTWPLSERATHRWCSCWQFDRGLVQWSIAVVLFVCHDDDHIPQRQVKRSAGHTCRRSCRPGTFHGSQRDGGVNGSCMEPLCGSVCSGICLSTLSRHIYESCRNSTGAGEDFGLNLCFFRDCQMSQNTTKMDTTTRYQKHLPKLHFRKKRECSMRKTHTHRLYYSVVYVDIVIFLQKSEMYNFSSFSKFFKVFHATHVYVTC